MLDFVTDSLYRQAGIFAYETEDETLYYESYAAYQADTEKEERQIYEEIQRLIEPNVMKATYNTYNQLKSDILKAVKEKKFKEKKEIYCISTSPSA